MGHDFTVEEGAILNEPESNEFHDIRSKLRLDLGYSLPPSYDND